MTSMRSIPFVLFLALIVTACGGSDQSESPAGDAEKQIRTAFGELGQVGKIESTEWDGVYEVMLDGNRVYASADGSYLITGDLYRAEGGVNLTERKRIEARKDTLEALEPEDAIVFAPDGEIKHAVWVFTDIDCPYCQRFHQHIDQYNKLGIEVRYLAYPRAGRGSQNWRTTEAVWCAEDPQTALTRAKQDAEVESKADCGTKAVEQGYLAGQAVGLRGTPMIVGADGRALGAYMPPAQLLRRLRQTEGSAG